VRKSAWPGRMPKIRSHPRRAQTPHRAIHQQPGRRGDNKVQRAAHAAGPPVLAPVLAAASFSRASASVPTM
jgi:hypothetical protein